MRVGGGRGGQKVGFVILSEVGEVVEGMDEAGARYGRIFGVEEERKRWM